MIDPQVIADSLREELRAELEGLGASLKLVGFLCAEAASSLTYAKHTRLASEAVGVEFELRQVEAVCLVDAIEAANADPSVHGIMVYYPVLDGARDSAIRDVVAPSKDVEGLTNYWRRRLYHNGGLDEGGRVGVSPCTSLAVMALIGAAEAKGVAGKTITIFNRSEVVGRPLASLLASEGATVYSFDVKGPLEARVDGFHESGITRAEALAASDIIITGVPDPEFDQVDADEIKDDVIAINFSALKNFTDEAEEKARVFVPRIGSLTTTMALQNILRLYLYQQQSTAASEPSA